ncbi:hypothetical protein [Thiolinea disciformis]|uniref:hypothetical protein n=1 Tax=Thiolinea disciformis TaxID=125614 RepID=UPI00035E2FBB|nr:hypothetical protein [Thiolinea disciformis]
MSLEKRAQFMQIVAMILGGYALLWGLAPFELLNWPARFILSLSAGELNQIAQPLTPQVQWLSAIGSGLLMAVAIISYGIIAPALHAEDIKIIKAFKLAMIVWYVMDSVGSLVSGFAINILFNTIFIIAIIAPLWRVENQISGKG